MNEERPDARRIGGRVQHRIVFAWRVIASEWSAPPAPAAARRKAPFDFHDEVSPVADHLPVDAEYRSERAFTAWKYAMWKAGCKMPTQTVSGMTKCFCGVMINTRTSGDHIRARHMEVTA